MLVDLGVEIVPFGGGEGAEHEAKVDEVELLVPGPWLTGSLLALSSTRSRNMDLRYVVHLEDAV